MRIRSGRAARALTVVVAVLTATTWSIAPAASSLGTEVPRDDTWITNGRVWSIVRHGPYIYLAGGFSSLAPNTGRGVLLDSESGRLLPGSPRINGPVRDAVPDGSGGWYVVGGFTSVNGVDRGRGAHLRADGTLGDWNPSANAVIHQIERVGSALVIGGEFTTVKGVARSRLAATGPLGGPLGGWQAEANGPVLALTLSADGNRLFVGGSFSNLGGATRTNAGAVSAATGAVNGFAPTVNGEVRAIALAPDRSRVYLGGTFTSAGLLVPRQRVAAVAYDSGLVDPLWRADTDGPVHTLAVLPDGTLYIGGSFTRLNGVNRANAAAIGTDRQVTPWNPAPGAVVNTIAPAPDAESLWLGGVFTSVRFQDRVRLARVNPTNGNLVGSVNPRPSAQVRVVVPTSTGVAFLGGDFAGVGLVRQPHLARLHASTGALDTTFRPAIDGPVETAALSDDGTTLYLGGRFNTANGVPRRRAAALALPSGAVTSFNPDVDGIAVQAIDQRGSKVVIGGQFSRVGGLPRTNLARLDATTGAADLLWAPNPNKQVRDVDILANGNVIAAGQFDSLGLLTPRRYLAELDTNGVATSWDPSPSSFVYQGVLDATESTYYAAILGPGGGGGNAVEAFTRAGNGARRWRTNTNGDVQALDLSPDGKTVYAGGHFGTVSTGGSTVATRERMMALRAVDGVLLPWRPRLDTAGTGVFAVLATTEGVDIGGDFSRVGPVSAHGFATFPGTP